MFLAITPAQISKWVVAGYQDEEVPDDRENITIEVTLMVQSLSDMQQSEAELNLEIQ